MVRREPTKPRAALQFTRAEVGAGYLWLQYSIDPVPAQVRSHGPVRDRECGIALDGEQLALPHCAISYRVALDWMHVVGVVAIGPDVVGRPGPLHIRFAPLAGTEELDQLSCDVEVELHDRDVTRFSAHILDSSAA